MRVAPTGETQLDRWLSSPRIRPSRLHGQPLPRANLCSSRTQALGPVFAGLNQYRTTTHFNGQSTIRLDGDGATGESYCLAHHLRVDGDTRTMMIASMRYLNAFVKQNEAWLFAERKLMVDWTETRPRNHLSAIRSSLTFMIYAGSLPGIVR